ncbi:MAG: alanine--tRNA ligase [Desulfovibrio sp.]|nr:alanine--tRNA ligase [Desulfovibrio sp.]
MLSAAEIRQRFLRFFESHQHQIVASGPLIPKDDKTLLFTNAGMVQFKQLFLGAEKRAYTRATTCQKCLRVSGKHNDLENVGRTARHHTFFEMLGNFSFGDYFKKEAITWAWDFVTKELALPAEKLWVTIYREDDEAAALWQSIAHLPNDRIVRMGEKDNFWTMGDTGPCGPCSEIYIDQGEDMACGPNCGIGQCDCDRFLEIWNLVFTQFDQAADGTRSLLAAPNIDTGMGLERIAAVCQGKRSNFDCDLFQDLIQFAAQKAHVTYSFSAPDTNDTDTALRVIADHARSAAFLICEGVLPSNESRGYVLRRLLRRALRFATLLGVHEPFLYQVASHVCTCMGESYPELVEHQDFIARVVREEEVRFAQTLDKGIELLDAEMANLAKNGVHTIPGDLCFLLYDTHGFPLDIVNDIAEKQGFTVDTQGFETLMAKQRDRARAHQKQDGLLGQVDAFDERMKRLAAKGVQSVFVGYTDHAVESPVSVLLNAQGEMCDELGRGEEGYCICAKTPFYGESGGQIGDTGTFVAPQGKGRIVATVKPVQTLIVQKINVDEGCIRVGESVRLAIDEGLRQAVCRNHSATHMLHAALRTVLGTHVHQMGSLVTPKRLRFDFSHVAPMTHEELAQVEHLVNQMILADYPVTTSIMHRDEAKALGAMALFDEKYGDEVRVVTMGDAGQGIVASRELCGGTHVGRTGEVGSCLILGESGVASGTRRIEAVTGEASYASMCHKREILAGLEQLLKTGEESLLDRVIALQSEVKKLRKAKESQGAKDDIPSLLAKAVTFGDIRVLTLSFDGMAMKQLRTQMDSLRSHLDKQAVICLAGISEGKVSLLLHVSKDLHTRLTAPALINDVAKCVGGSGGGRPDLAQAGGTKPEGVSDAFAALVERIQGGIAL